MNVDQGLFVPGILGILEGLTEFLPVSSTAHLLLAEHFLGLSGDDWKVFTVLIQLGGKWLRCWGSRTRLRPNSSVPGRPGWLRSVTCGRATTMRSMA